MCDLQQCTFIFLFRLFRRTGFIPLVPDCVLVGGWVRDWPTTGNQCRFLWCTADRSSYLDHWCSPTGLDRIKRLFTWDTSCGLVVGLWDNLAAFVSVQWLPQGFSWISDSKVEPTSLTNRAIIGGIVFSGQNKEHPTTPIPVPLCFGGPYHRALGHPVLSRATAVVRIS